MEKETCCKFNKHCWLSSSIPCSRGNQGSKFCLLEQVQQTERKGRCLLIKEVLPLSSLSFLSIWKDENLSWLFLRSRKAPPPPSAVQFNSCKHRASMADPRNCLCNQRIILAEISVGFLHVWKSPDLSDVGQMGGREHVNNQSVNMAAGLCLNLYFGVLGLLEYNLNECITDTKKHAANNHPNFVWKFSSPGANAISSEIIHIFWPLNTENFF